MKTLQLGQDLSGNSVGLDLDREKIKFILLVGKSGSGKSVFHEHLYRQLMGLFSPTDLGFVFFDMTAVEFTDFDKRYLFRSTVTNALVAIKILQELAKTEPTKRLVIHLEECDMVYQGRKQVEEALAKLKEMENVLIVFSTSRIDRDYLKDWSERFVDFKAVFAVPTEGDSFFLLGNDSASRFKEPGERILALNGKQVHCRPFLEVKQ